MKFDGAVTTARPVTAVQHRWLGVALVVIGTLAGAAILLVTSLASVSGFVVGSFKFADEGALVVPGLLVPCALFCGWTIALRRGAQPRDLALFAVGLHLGIGAVGLFTGSFAFFLLAGFNFVYGSALMAALGLWWGRRASNRSLLVAMAIAVIAAFALVVIYHWVLAIAAGVAVAHIQRKPSRTPLVVAGLAVAVVVLALVPITASPPV